MAQTSYWYRCLDPTNTDSSINHK